MKKVLLSLLVLGLSFIFESIFQSVVNALIVYYLINKPQVDLMFNRIAGVPGIIPPKEEEATSGVPGVIPPKG